MSSDMERGKNNGKRTQLSAVRNIVFVGITLIGVVLGYNYVTDLGATDKPVQQAVFAPNIKQEPIPVEQAPVQPVVPGARRTVEIDTILGRLQVELFADKAPTAVAELVNLINTDYFKTGTVLEIRPGLGFVIAKVGDAVKSYHAKDELNTLSSQRGSVAIAKSATSSAYLNNIFFGFQSRPELERHYIIIGQVTKGLEPIERSAPGVSHKVNGFKVNDAGQKQAMQASGVQGE